MSSQTKVPYSRQFATKSRASQELIKEAADILESFGVPMADLSARGIERMAMAFVAVADVETAADWSNAADRSQARIMKTRDIILYINRLFGETISPGSYDDIRRKDLKRSVMAGVIVQTNPIAARNSPTRGYALSPEYAAVIRLYGTPAWPIALADLMAGATTLADKLAQLRTLEQVPITIPSGRTLTFSPGGHNLLQKAIIEEFLPRFGRGAEVLYVGDSADRYLLLESDRLQALNFFELSDGELPDVVAHAPEPNWIFLIEAVHTDGPIDTERLLELRTLAAGCSADLVFVTAFQNRETFRRHAPAIAWETEVWIAEVPDHLIHYNGSKFLGPYQPAT